MRRRLRITTVFGLGVAGLVGGHALGYALAVPDPQHRTMLLAESGHGYLPSLSWIAVVVGISAIVAGVASGRLDGARSVRFGVAFRRLAVLQCTGFVALEVVERAVSSAPSGSLSWALVAVGLLAQVLCAVLLALLVAGLRRLGSLLSTELTIATIGTRNAVLAEPVALPSARTPRIDRVRGPPQFVRFA